MVDADPVGRESYVTGRGGIRLLPLMLCSLHKNLCQCARLRVWLLGLTPLAWPEATEHCRGEGSLFGAADDGLQLGLRLE